MGKVIVGMTMSLDGFINDAAGSVEKLYPSLEILQESTELKEDIKNTGAVVMGRHAFEMGDPDSFADSYEFQVPLFVVTHHMPDKQPKENDHLTFTFINEGVKEAILQAKEVAGERNVIIIGGAKTAQQALNSGLVDELQVEVMPVLLGGGIRFFEHILTDKLSLEKIRVAEVADGRTIISCRVSYN